MEKIKISIVGSLNNQKKISGFTFLELIVVISIVSALLFFSIPVFNKISIFSNSSGQIGGMVRLMENLKTRAVEKNTDFTLNIHPVSTSVWVTNTDMNEEARQEAEDNATVLSGDIVFLDLKFPDIQQTPDQNYQLMFYKEGHSDFAMLHITESDSDITLKLEPFLSNVQVIEGHISFEDCK